MVIRQRNYAEEYRRRIEHGLKRGLSRPQARGHRRANEPMTGKLPVKRLDSDRLQIALQTLRQEGSLKEAARSIGVSQERLRRIAIEEGLIERNGRRWRISNQLLREMLIFSDGEAHLVVLDTFPEASKAGAYMSAVNYFLSTNRRELLKKFEAHGVRDRHGKFFPFETDPNRLYRLSTLADRSFENIYRIVL